MAAANPASGKPLVTVIVPARNEEASLGACLDSLISQTGVEKEIIVVDDGSTDATRQIADSFAGVRVIEPGPLPDGWTGKNNAVVAGAKIARGEWLLFTDADTVHTPGSLARSLAEATQNGASLLSYSPEQVVRGFWEKATMPVIFAELAATFKPKEVSDPKSPAAAANGQYVLVKRSAYEAVGGHAAVATDLLEDVALARRVKSSGRKIFFRFGGDAVRTRMYRSFAQLREGWTKNLALLFPHPGKLAFSYLVQFLIVVSILVGVSRSIFEGAPCIPSGSLLYPCVSVSRYASLYHWALIAGPAVLFFYMLLLSLLRTRKSHFSWTLSPVALVGMPMFAYLLWRSQLFHKKGQVQWKGRSYTGGAHTLAGKAESVVQASNDAAPNHI